MIVQMTFAYDVNADTYRLQIQIEPEKGMGHSRGLLLFSGNLGSMLELAKAIMIHLQRDT